MRVLAATVLLAAGPALAASAGPAASPSLLKEALLRGLDAPPPADADRLEAMGREVDRALAALAQAAPAARGAIDGLRARLPGLRRALEATGSDAPGAPACAALPSRSAERAACLMDGLRTAVAALRIDASSSRTAASQAAPAGAIPRLGPAALARRPGVAAQMRALESAFAARAAEPVADSGFERRNRAFMDKLFGRGTRKTICRFMSDQGWVEGCDDSAALPPVRSKRPIVGDVPPPRLPRSAPRGRSNPLGDVLEGVERGAAEAGDALRRVFDVPPGGQTVADTLRRLERLPAAARGGIDARALELTARYFDREGDRVTNRRVVAIVDTATKRMHLIDVDRAAADPKGAITTLPTAVSARGISSTAPKHTELGVYITAGEAASGGRILGPIPVLQLQGQTPPSKNDKAGNLRAWNAGILIHSNEILKRGRRGLRRVRLALDHSNGCFHIAEKHVRDVIDRLKGGAVLLAYHPTLLPDAAVERSAYRRPAN